MKKINPFALILLLCASFAMVSFDKPWVIWEKSHSGILEAEVTALAIHPQNNSVIFAGTSKAVYRSTDKGKNFYGVFNIPGSARGVNYLSISSAEPHLVYAATDSGLFAGGNYGYDWKNIYQPADPEERRSLWALEDQSVVYVATLGGLFYKKLNDTVWQEEKGLPGNQPAYFIAKDNTYLYFATAHEVFCMNKTDRSFSKVFSATSRELKEDAQAPNFESDVVAMENKQIHYLAVSHDGLRLYVAAPDGIFVSENHGESWQRLESDGLPLEEVTSLVSLTKEEIMIGTHRGLFRLNEGRLSTDYKGLESNNVEFLANDTEGNLYAATDRGVFFMETEKAVAKINIPDLKVKRKKFDLEPSIRDVQQMAIHYAEVAPEKIQSWRRAVEKRAWFPSLSINLDQDRNRTVADSIYGSSSSGGSHYIGPDDKTFYDNFGWGVSLSWDLGDLVWNGDQTSIDSRSKLMVELREDVLDQVTRLYFERRRAQVEFLGAGALPEFERLDKEMRIEELTALIDGFTGGEFGRRIEENKVVSHPRPASHKRRGGQSSDVSR